MATHSADEGIHSLLITKNELIKASPEIVFKAILDEVGPENKMPDGTSLSMKIEPWIGGRWYRDLGNNNGHLWGHVQVIKAPYLIEMSGPLFMSFPAMNHVQYRLTVEDSGTRLQFTHRGMGQIPGDLKDGVTEGWSIIFNRIQERAEKNGR